jgi:hypothetical protein
MPARTEQEIGVRDTTHRATSGARYLVAMAGGGALAMLGFLVTLAGLNATGHLPPPALSNSLCVDEKLSFMRQTPANDPNLLVIGSSVAWRGLDSAALHAAAPRVRPLNGAFCGLHVNQAQFTMDWLLGRFANVDTVLMMGVPEDFTDCTETPAAVFNRDSADRYVFGRGPAWPFYLEYFDPVSLIRNATKVAAQRSNRIPFDPLVFTRDGDGPLDVETATAPLGYHSMPPMDEACFGALRQMAAGAVASGRRFIYVQMPLKPEWSRSYDPDGKVHDLFAAKLDHALAGTGGHSWDASTQAPLPDAAFTDAIHLRWSAVAGLSRSIGQQALAPGGS